MKNPAARKQGGFTIVEIVVVITLMILAIAPIAKVIASALEASNEEMYLTQCAFLAQMKIEEIRSRASCYTTPGATDTCPISGDSSDFEQDFTQTAAQCSLPSPFDRYDCVTATSFRVAPSAGSDTGGFKVIQVRVWYDKDGDATFDAGEASVFLETQLTQKSPDWGYQAP